MTSSTEGSRAARSGPRGTSKANPAFAMAFFARTIRCAIVTSFDRKARAISSVVKPPTTLRVSAARASGGSMGWQAVKMRPSSSSPRSSSIAASIAAALSPASLLYPGCVRAISSCLRSRILSRRRVSSARRLATVISQAPGFSGTPVFGHSARATTSASCASSSARSTLRTMRARPAMSLARSMRKVASTALCVAAWSVSPAVVTLAFSASAAGETSQPVRRSSLTNQPTKAELRPTVSGDAELSAFAGTGRRELLGRREIGQIRHLVERPDLDLARAVRHGIGAARDPGHGLVHVLDLPDREAGDQLAGLGERPIDDLGVAATIEDDALGLSAGLEAGAGHEDAGLDQFLGELVH